MRHLACLLSIILSSAVHAAEPMSASEFETCTTGKTLFYSQNGGRYGAERYMQDKRVQWTFLDGEWKDGHWYADGEEICFVYEDRPDPQCWVFYYDPPGIVAEFRGEDSTQNRYEARDIGEEVLCWIGI
jgi:hypothetical protein